MTTDPQFLQQHEALNTGVGFAALARRTILSLTGPDRTQILQSFTTNDIKQLVPGAGCEAFVTNSQGKTLGHVMIFCEADQYILDTTPNQAAPIIGHFQKYIITEEVEFIDRTADSTDILVAGAKAREFLSKIAGENPPTEPLAHTSAVMAGHSVVIRRTEFAGPVCYFIQASARDAVAIANELAAAGATPCDSAAIETARIEIGFPLFGVDITPDNLPQEVARNARAISFTKGCYLGQETVARIDAVGHVNRLLVGLKFASQDVPASGSSLLAEEQQVGHVTSAAWSPKLKAPIALGYLRRTCAKPGAQLFSAAGSAEVVNLPLP